MAARHTRRRQASKPPPSARSAAGAGSGTGLRLTASRNVKPRSFLALNETAALAPLATKPNVKVWNAMLAGGSHDQRAVVHDMALFVRPPLDEVQDRLTMHAADLMDHLADRATCFARVLA